MSELSKQALKVENNQSFPNNNAGLITPSNLRTFNEDMIDSTVNQAVYTADSASFDARINAITGSATDTGSLLTTASFDNGTRNLTFTKGDSSTFAVNIPDASGSVLPSGVVSGSSQIILQDTTGLLSGSRIDGEVALATNATYAQNTITTGKNVHSAEIQKGTPLYFTGSGTSGNLVGILPADAGNPTLMPAGGIAGETIAVGAEGVVLIDGYIGGVDTSLFASGDEVFVGVGGGYTNVAPTGSALIQKLGNVEKAAVNGSGVINGPGATRSVPNIQEGYTWVGDVNSVPQPIPTSSFGGGSGFPFSGSAEITGSLVVSETIKSQVYMNPQTLDGFVIPTDNNAMLVGPVAISGSVVVEGNSNLIVLSQITSSATPLPSGVVSGSSQLTASYDLRYTLSGSVQPLPSGLLSSSVTDFTTYSASVDSRINNISFDTSSLATTGSNTFIGTQTITGSLFVSSSSTNAYEGVYYKVSNAGGPNSNVGFVIDGRLTVNGPTTLTTLDIGSVFVSNLYAQTPSPLLLRNSLTMYETPEAGGNDLKMSLSGSLFVSRSVAIDEAIRLSPSDPLPSGTTGSLAVSGSSLYFFDGTWRQVSLI